MKNKLILFCLFVLQLSLGQNLIKNPDFELGTIPIYPPYYVYNFPENVPFWRQGCDTDILGNLMTPDILTVGASDCNWSVPTNNHTSNLPVNISGSKRYVYCGYSQTNNLKESIIGELTQTLTAGKYTVSFFGSKIPGVGYCTGNLANYASDPGANVEVVLRNSANICGASSTVLWTSSQINTLGSWQQAVGSFTIDCAMAAQNYNRIEFRIKTANGVHGVFIDDVSLTKVNLDPQISGLTNFCAGNPLTFTGSIAPGTSSQSHLWEIQECTSAGVVIGSPIYGLWVAGNPSTFTFPSSLNLPCNKFYRVKLAPSNNVSCEWFEKTKIIKLNCSPTLNPIPSQTICSGSNVTFNVSTLPVSVYANGGFVGTFTSNPIVLTPSNTTTYSFVVSNKFGCTASRNSTVTVNNCPTACFQIKNIQSVSDQPSLYGPQQVKTLCLPQIAIDGSCSMYESGYHLRLAKFDLTTWSFVPGGELFNDWVSTSGAAPSNIDLSSYGSFTIGSIYLVNLSVGPTWNSAQPQFFKVINCTNNKIIFEEQEKINVDSINIDIYPNPTSGVIQVDLNENTSGKIELYSFEGKLVFSKELNQDNQVTIDLSGFSKGVYLAKVNTNNKVVVKKIIKE